MFQTGLCAFQIGLSCGNACQWDRIQYRRQNIVAEPLEPGRMMKDEKNQPVANACISIFREAFS